MSTRSLILPPGAFRLLLALAVVLNHLTLVQSGRGAVLLFFVLSGYWVTDLWLRTAGPNRLATFYLNRALRIWPLYLAVAMIAAVALDRPFGAGNLALVGVASQPLPHLIGTEWSLDIEVQFYAILPLLALLGDRLGRAGWIALLALGSIAGWHLADGGALTVLAYLPFFGMGMAMRQWRWVPSRGLAQASLAGFVMLCVAQVALATAAPDLLVSAFAHWPDEAIAAVWVVVLTPYVAASMQRSSDATDRRLGDLSYPLYLVHAPLVAMVERAYDWRTAMAFMLLLLGIALATVLIWALIDRPAERCRKLLLARRATPYPAALAA
jgi:peptidoglycan/LPS O-acetylase OafA/YrhL